MAWDTEIVTLVRLVIGDLTVPYRYSDDRLEQTVVAATGFVISDIGDMLAVSYDTDVTVPEITPDPTEQTPKDNDFINLIVLRTACFLDHAEARSAASTAGFMIKEFQSQIDTRGISQARLGLLEKGFCKTYNDMVWEFTIGNSSTGRAVLTPFRQFYNSYYGSGNIYGGR